jgi:purine-binding chemotaxis protein CheW
MHSDHPPGPVLAGDSRDPAEPSAASNGPESPYDNGLDWAESFESAQEDEAAVLRERAASLAAAPKTLREEDRDVEVVEFVVAQERYAVEVPYVNGVHPVTHLTPLPCTPSFLLGVTRVRGRVVSVADVREFFGLPKKGITDLSKVVVLRGHDMEIGIVADAIVGVSHIPNDVLRSELPAVTGMPHEYLKAVTADHLFILNAERLLSDRRMVVDEEIGD